LGKKGGISEAIGSGGVDGEGRRGRRRGIGGRWVGVGERRFEKKM
jgi:hypothetical protein